MVQDVVAHRLGEQRVELAEVAEHDMAAEVPREPGRVDDRGGQAAGALRALEDHPVAMAEPLELARAGQPARAGADDRYGSSHGETQ